MSRTIRHLALSCFVIFLALFPGRGFSSSVREEKIMVINSYHRGCTWTESIMDGIEDRLGDVPGLELYVEYLDVLRLSPKGSNSVFEHIIERYRIIKPDMVITTDDYALNFALDHFDVDFLKTGLVFCGVNDFKGKSIYGFPQISGVFERLDIKKTIDFAFRLHPKTRTIGYITDSGNFSDYVKSQFTQSLLSMNKDVSFVELKGRNLKDLGAKIDGLPHDSVLLFMSFLHDDHGKYIPLSKAAGFIKNSTNLPVYALDRDAVEAGFDGGFVISGYDQGLEAAVLAMDILGGKQTGPVRMRDLPGRYIFNYNASMHTDKVLDLLPEGCEVINRTGLGADIGSSRMAWLLFLIAGLCLFLAVSCFRLSLKRKGALRELRDLNRQMRILFNGSNIALWRYDLATKTLTASESYWQMLGYGPGETFRTIGDWEEAVHPDDLDLVLTLFVDVLNNKRDKYEVEYRIRGKNGKYIWISSRGACDTDEEGNISSLLGIYRECTRRKNAEQEVRASLKEKDMLLKEIHHRVKNNLQIVSSLLNIQSSYVNNPDDADLFLDSKLRVRSMSRIHERLYHTGDFRRLDFCDYMARVCEDILAAYPLEHQRITLNIPECDLRLSLDKAVPCGLILNELVTNAVKHAFKGRDDGAISIRAVMLDRESALLSVKDNGVGLPPGFDPEAADSLGMVLIHNLVAQLDGDCDIKALDGVEVRITFSAL